MMKRQNIPPEDDYEIRCPRLGHQISFSYCRSENRGLQKIGDFPVSRHWTAGMNISLWKNILERN
jgi:hypothetical protein